MRSNSAAFSGGAAANASAGCWPLFVAATIVEPLEIENQADPAIAQNRASGKSPDMLKLLTEALDHDLLFADQLVDEKAEALPAIVGHDKQSICGVGRPRRDVEFLMQPNDGQQVLAHQRHLRPALNRRERVRRGTQHLAHRVDRNDIPFLADSGDETVNNRKRQWKTQA